MGFYDSAFKNIGNQTSYAGGVIGGYLFHQHSKEKSEVSKSALNKEIEGLKKQRTDFQTRIDFMNNIIENQQKEIKNYQKGVAEAIEMTKGLIK